MLVKKIISVFVLLLGLNACDSSENIHEYTATTTSLSSKSYKGNNFIWASSENWQYRTPQNPMHLSVFITSDRHDIFLENPHSIATVSLTFLKGESGDLKSNINRWRRQLQLPSIDNIKPLVQNRTTNLGDISFIKIQNIETKKSIFAAIYEKLDGTLFIKMHGPLHTLNFQTENFITFIESIKVKKGNS